MPASSIATPRRSSYPLHVHIAYLFVALITCYALVNTFYQYRSTRQMLLTATESLFGQIGSQTVRTVESIYSPALTVVDLMAQQHLMYAFSLDERLESLAYLAEALQSQPSLSAVYIGYENGDFFLVRKLTGAPLFGAAQPLPPGTAFLVQSLSDGDGEFLYYRRDLTLIEKRFAPGYRFDPRTRPWYQSAIGKPAHQISDPYLFFTTREVGTTLSRRTANGRCVVGADITLAVLDDVLGKEKMTPHAVLSVVDGKGNVIAASGGQALMRSAGDHEVRQARLPELKQPVLERLFDPSFERGNARTLEVGGQEWLGYTAPIPLRSGNSLFLAVAAPQGELLVDAQRLRMRSLLIATAILAVAALAAYVISRLASRPLKALTEEAQRIRAMRFGKSAPISSFITEIDELAEAMALMKSTIRNFLDIGEAMAAERRFEPLLARILEETTKIAQAKGGVIYLADEAGGLVPAQARLDDVALVNPRAIPVLNSGSDGIHPAVIAMAGSTTLESLLPSALNDWYGAFGRFEKPLTTISIPLKNRQDELVGVVFLLQDEKVLRYGVGHELITLVEALSGTAAVTIETQRLILEQKKLLESFIQLVAGAIDAKSPYTGGHCQRVPELTKMLARAACEARDGPYAGFALSDDEWEELHIAAWLHDCGKVTTPEYVVDKATKLETICDRIHEVRMRFEVLKRDAEIGMLKAVVAGGDRNALAAQLRDQLAVLDDEFYFVAECNQGGEFMAPERVERLQAIAARTWQRTLDDRLGISHDELLRKGDAPRTLPVTEALLADKPEHRFPRSPRDALPEGHGFKMTVPELLYNRGELHNLAIGRGTLSEEDRYKINEHIVQTIVMLEKLPFPRHLKRVPEIAGGHHEKMDGNGYPKRLTRDEMSDTARMMAIADIFEALTAVDRPYKKGKTLSQSIAIMSKMRDDAHIDPELFALFLESGVYLAYAKRFLRPEQIDDVDIARALGVTA
ncbi:HD domain-containing phosphohydrolase [Jeongeupia chitinilytica]|uniref:Metal-dependent phosphohydrolase n=1 Tax=Jeongeupia chitinilytica TaxID=1041641 RepID=A0ABQ3GW77_9NEIS|nr:HD domain-containing phosphohydrolase [Jeongeupia chitinilytica]GHD55313.1 metal-dependent phosphohydrolase [Jeongeupia chitinilytica]